MGDGPARHSDTAHVTSVAEATTALLNDSAQLNPNFSTGARLERVGEVTVKGLAATPMAAVHSAADMLKPENWGKDAITIGSSAALGAALRIALPESGALKTIVGVGMGVMFLKDAAMPVVHSWGKVWDDGSSKTMDSAAKNMGTGLGDFAVQGGVSVLAAGLTAKVTPWAMNKVAPSTWSTIETWKANNLAGASSLSLADTRVGANPAATHAAAPRGIASDRIDLSIKVPTGTDVTLRAPESLATGAPRPSIRDLSPQQLSEILKASQITERATLASGKLSRFGIQGSDGNFHSHDDVVSLLLAGKDPAVEPAGVQTARSVPLSRADLTQPNSIVLGDQTAASHGLTDEAADIAARKGGGGHNGRPKTPPGGDTAKPPTDAAAPATDLTRPPVETAKVTDASRILNAKNLMAQADAIKDSLGQISDEAGLIMDRMNQHTGAIDVRTNPHVQPLRGYEVASKAAFDLAAQVGTDPGSFQQVDGLFERFAAGALQSGTGESSDIAAHVVRMDLYAAENLATYRGNIIKAGIDPDVALAQKPAPPLVEGTSDVQRIGTDQDGNPVYSHEGPHTLRSIYGPNGEPVWPLDMVKTPIREIGMRGVNTSGIYGHELMHDQFGQMAKFDPEVRDAKLGEAAAKAWGADANKMVDLPNGGKDPQQVLLDAVVRKLAKVDPADHDAFLADNLGLDPQTRVMRGARAADTILGPAGRTMVQVPGSGAMPLEVFVGNIAAMADVRTPTEVLAEMQGKGTPAETTTAISANVDKILGPNGHQMIPQADGSKLSLKDTVMKVSEATRNPKFDTYDKPMPAQMSNADILVNVAKAWADETFADWGAAAESGQSAAPYFQALSKDGLLRGSTVTGQDMRSPENELGIEAHPTDKLRPRYQAALVRALATAGGQHDQVLLDWADALDKYSRDASKPGPILLPSMDTPGQAISIPEEVFDKFIPQLVEAQLNTPLPRLQGKTLFDILPDLRKNFRINQGIADTWVSAIEAGKAPDTVPFDVAGTKMTHVYGAGQLTFLKLVSDGMDPIKANEAVNAFSDSFGDQIVKDRAKVTAAPALGHRLQFAAMARGLDDSNFHPLAGDRTAGITSPIGADAGSPPSTSRSQALIARIGQGANWLAKASSEPSVLSATAAYQVQDLLGLHKVQQDVLQQKQ